MPILPIDLQSMFSQLNQVSKDQAVQKDITPQNQLLQGQEIANKTVEKDHTVNEADEVGEGIENIKNKKKKGKETRGKAKQKEAKEKKEQDQSQAEIYKDPNLGHHIDIIS